MNNQAAIDQKVSKDFGRTQMTSEAFHGVLMAKRGNRKACLLQVYITTTSPAQTGYCLNLKSWWPKIIFVDWARYKDCSTALQWAKQWLIYYRTSVGAKR
jgi:hypothetical protein